MATNSTTNYAIPYPNPGDAVNVAGDMGDMANAIDNVLYSKVGRNFTNTFTVPQIFEVLTDIGPGPYLPAVRITQSGTGDAFVVSDNGYPDSSSFIIDNSGKVAIGKTTADYPLDVVGDSAFTGTVIANLFSGSGASLTSLNGSNISSGTVAEARISSSIARLNSPSLITPSLGVATATSINGTSIPTSSTLVTTATTSLSSLTSVNGTSIPTSKTLVVTTDIGSSVQAWDADLDSIAGLTGTTGILKKTAANTWTLDTSAYSTTVGTVTSVATGSGLSGGTITSTGTISLATAFGDTVNPYASKTANYILAAPNGSAGVPVFRALATADIPGVANSLVIKADTGTTEGTDLYTFNGSAAKSLNIIAGTNISITKAAGSWTIANTQAPVTSITFGSTGLTPATVSSGALTVAGTLVAGNGGTGFATYAVGDMLYASGATAFSKLTAVATGSALISGGATTAPSWGKIGLTTHVSGTLPTANGGTNLTAFTANGAVYATSTSALTTGTLPTASGGTNLTSFTSGGAMYATSTSALTTGTLPISAGGTNQTGTITAVTPVLTTTALALATNYKVSFTPTANVTLTSTVPASGIECTLIVLTSGTSSWTLTFGTGFVSQGTLATGIVTGKYFVVKFISNGTSLIEISRTVAM
jgi:hypothetical protein